MENPSQDLEPIFDSESNHIAPKKFEIVQSRAQNRDRDSLSENFNDEIEAWARQAMASNGFGDY